MPHRLPTLLGLDNREMTYHGLARLAIGIVAVFFVLAIMWHHFAPVTPLKAAQRTFATEGPEAGEKALREYLDQHPEDSQAWLSFVQYHASRGPGLTPKRALALEVPELTSSTEPVPIAPDVEQFLKRAITPPPHVLRAWYQYHAMGLQVGVAQLISLDDAASAAAAGEMYERGGLFREAIEQYRLSLQRDAALADSRAREIQCLLQLGEKREAARLADEPAYNAALDSYLRTRIALINRDYRAVFQNSILSELKSYTPAMLAGGLLVGFGWFVFCLHLGCAWRWHNREQLLAVAAVVLGFLSAYACLWMVVISDDIMESQQKTGFAFNLVYSLAIGLREELIKLLFVLPLLPYLSKIRDDLRIITMTSLVGLGFAINENLGYYLASGGASVVSRFLTANFFHIILTGYCGYYLVKAVQYGGDEWTEFSMQTLRMILFHAMYDFVLIEPSMAEYSLLGMMLYIWLSQMYLRLVIYSASHERRPVPLTRLFVAVLAVAVGVTYMLLAAEHGIRPAAMMTLAGLFGVVLIAYMFFREFNEPIRH